VVLAGTHGLGDNPNASYTEPVELAAAEKRVFSGVLQSGSYIRMAVLIQSPPPSNRLIDGNRVPG